MKKGVSVKKVKGRPRKELKDLTMESLRLRLKKTKDPEEIYEVRNEIHNRLTGKSMQPSKSGNRKKLIETGGEAINIYFPVKWAFFDSFFRTHLSGKSQSKKEYIASNKEYMALANKEYMTLANKENLQPLALANKEYMTLANKEYMTLANKEEHTNEEYVVCLPPSLFVRAKSTTLPFKSVPLSHKMYTTERKLAKVLSNEIWCYCGDTEFVIFGKCPDFLRKDNKPQVLEIFGNFTHGPGDALERIAYFEKFGFKCLVIWEDALEWQGLPQNIKRFEEGDTSMIIGLRNETVKLPIGRREGYTHSEETKRKIRLTQIFKGVERVPVEYGD